MEDTRIPMQEIHSELQQPPRAISRRGLLLKLGIALNALAVDQNSVVRVEIPQLVDVADAGQ